MTKHTSWGHLHNNDGVTRVVFVKLSEKEWRVSVNGQGKAKAAHYYDNTTQAHEVAERLSIEYGVQMVTVDKTWV